MRMIDFASHLFLFLFFSMIFTKIKTRNLCLICIFLTFGQNRTIVYPKFSPTIYLNWVNGPKSILQNTVSTSSRYVSRFFSKIRFSNLISTVYESFFSSIKYLSYIAITARKINWWNLNTCNCFWFYPLSSDTHSIIVSK